MLDDALTRLREELRVPVPEDAGTEAQLVAAAEAFAARARGLELRVEEVVIHLKREIDTVLGTGVGPLQLDDIRRSLVTSAIKAYYLQ